MNALSLPDIKAFHADLLSLSAAGIPLAGSPYAGSLPLSGAATFAPNSLAPHVDSLRAALEAIEQRLAAASLEGRPLSLALKTPPHFSPQYLGALQAWMSSGRDPTALNDWTTQAERARRKQWRFRIACVQPLVWLSTAYVGLAYISLGVAPQFLVLSRQLRVAPGIALSVVLSIRESFPIWGTLVPILIVTLAGWLYFRTPSTRLAASPKRLPAPESSAVEQPEPTAWALTVGQAPESTAAQTSSAWVLVGGVLVLGIALCVFGPLIELLYSVTLPLGSTLPLGGTLPLGVTLPLESVLQLACVAEIGS